MTFDIRMAVADTLRTGGEAPAIAFDGRWRDWDWMRHFSEALDRIVTSAAIPDGTAIALVARNRPAHLAAMAAQTAAGRATAMIYSAQSPAKIAADIKAVAAPMVMADPEDWTVETLASADAAGAVAVAIEDGPNEASVRIVGGRSRAREGAYEKRKATTGFEMLSSGTTGAPKRVPLAWSTLSSAALDAKDAYAGTAARHAPQIMLHPIGNIAGVSYLLPIFAYAQPVVLMEKFAAEAWIDVVRSYAPSRASLPPAGVRMLLDSVATREDLKSLGLVVVGGGKLDVDQQLAFEARFGIPVLTAFGATEFAGVIANWTLDAYREFGEAKRGSAGRASANVQLRIVDQASSEPLGRGAIGLLEAKVARLGNQWIRTNDLASLDDDGFLFVHGRADGAINRGGFKIVPELVADALRAHPAVADAAVVAKADSRLGEVPVAAVELQPGTSASAEEILAFIADRLVRYQIPVDLRILDNLPRNSSMKISLGEVRELFA